MAASLGLTSPTYFGQYSTTNNRACSGVSIRTCQPRCCASDAAEAKRKEADRLALLAEQAAPEAEALSIAAGTLKPRDKVVRPPDNVAHEEGEDEPMALSAPLRWIGPYAAIALSLPELSSPAQKQRQRVTSALNRQIRAFGLE